MTELKLDAVYWFDYEEEDTPYICLAKDYIADLREMTRKMTSAPVLFGPICFINQHIDIDRIIYIEKDEKD